MKRILITGGAGYIGTHTCLELLENNYNVIVLDSLENSSIEGIKKIKSLLKNKISCIEDKLIFLKGDIRDESLLKNLFKKYNSEGNVISGVIHFAGLKSVKDSVNFPLRYWDVNVKGTINLLEIMNEYGCKNIIFSSSATIYSQRNIIPFKEDSKLEPINPYGNTKLSIEFILQDFFNSDPKNLKIYNLRYFNPIGAHPSGIIGEDPKGKPNNIFPLILNVASGELKKLYIFGNDWDTLDGTCIRDFIHVVDLAQAHVIALNHLLNSKPSLLNFNLGTGKGTTLLSLIKTFERVNKITVPYEFIGRRKGDLPILIADNSKSKQILNWIPKKNTEEMCIDGWRWKCGYKGIY